MTSIAPALAAELVVVIAIFMGRRRDRSEPGDLGGGSEFHGSLVMLTEAEAGTKICPLSFGVREIRGHDGCGIREGGPWNCSASKCMAWRWGGYKSVPSATVTNQNEASGFCGAFGRPAS